MNIKNTHKSAVVLPNGQPLPSNVATPVRDWEKVKENKVVAAWLRAGILVECGGEVQRIAPDKDALIAELAALGVKADKRKTVEKLEAMLAEAQSAQADGSEDEGGDGEGED